MSKFNTSIKKLNELWQQVEENSNEKKLKNNQDKFEFFINLLKQQNIKIPTEIFDSGDINVTTIESTDASTAIKSEIMPMTVNYSENIDINLPEVLLPFVKYSVEINSNPETEVHGVYEFDPSTWTGDSIEVKGDAQLIYKNNSLPTNRNINQVIQGISQRVNSDSFFIDNGISFALSSKVFKAEIVENDDSVKIGNITKITSVIDTGNANCSGGANDIETFEISPFENPGNEITSIGSTSFTGKGRLTIDTFVDEGEGCVPKQIITEETRTTLFGDGNYTMVLDISGGVISSNIKTQTFERNGNWLFWSNLKQKLFGLRFSDDENDFKEITIFNFPNAKDSGIEGDEPDTLPYTNITVKRNVGTVNPKPTIVKKSENIQLFSNVSTEKSLEKTGREFKNYIKTSSSKSAIPTYRFNLEGDFILTAPSIQKRFVTRNKEDITTQEFKSLGSNDFNAEIDKNENTFVSGTVANIFHQEERLSGSVITEFFTDPNNNSKHGILSLTSTEFTAVGDETVTVIPFDPELPPIITTRSNIIDTKNFDDSTTYSIGIIDGIDFPVYNDVYTPVETISTFVDIFQDSISEVGLFGFRTFNHNFGTLNVDTQVFFPTDEEGVGNSGNEITPDEINNINLGTTRINIQSFRPFDSFEGEGNFMKAVLTAITSNTYELTTENHSVLTKDIWIPSTDEVTLNIKAHLVNPLYWREERKYNK